MKSITWSFILIILSVIAVIIDFATLTTDPTSNAIQHIITAIVSGVLFIIGIVLLIIIKYKR